MERKTSKISPAAGQNEGNQPKKNTKINQIWLKSGREKKSGRKYFSFLKTKKTFVILKSQTHNFWRRGSKRLFCFLKSSFFSPAARFFSRFLLKGFPRNDTFVLLSARIRAFLATNGRRTPIFFKCGPA